MVVWGSFAFLVYSRLIYSLCSLVSAIRVLALLYVVPDASRFNCVGIRRSRFRPGSYYRLVIAIADTVVGVGRNCGEIADTVVGGALTVFRHFE